MEPRLMFVVFIMFVVIVLVVVFLVVVVAVMFPVVAVSLIVVVVVLVVFRLSLLYVHRYDGVDHSVIESSSIQHGLRISCRQVCVPEGLIIEKSSKDVNPGATPERSSVKTSSTVIAWAAEDTSTPGGDRLTLCKTGGAVSGFASWT